jgi:ribonucleoside-diphosphate reductase alpha chain
MISAVFRRGGDVSFVVDELKAVFDPRGGQWANGHYVPSLLAAIGDIIERHLVAIGFMPPREKPDLSEKARAVAIAVGDTPARPCPRCSSPSLIRQENCDSCIACGYSRCS